MLIVAPMAGHFPTLLRHTVKTMLADHDVYITDWKNARDVPPGRRTLRRGRLYRPHDPLLRAYGSGAHVVAVCQPCAALLATVAVMAQADHPCQPRSMTLMAGPVDTRVSPTTVNQLATEHPIEWFEQNLITHRAAPLSRRASPGLSGLHAGIGLPVDELGAPYPAHVDLFDHIRKGEEEKAEANRNSTTSISRSPTCRRSSISRPCRRCSRNSTAPGQVRIPWHARRARRDPQDRAAHRGGRARRYLLCRPDARGA